MCDDCGPKDTRTREEKLLDELEYQLNNVDSCNFCGGMFKKWHLKELEDKVSPYIPGGEVRMGNPLACGLCAK